MTINCGTVAWRRLNRWLSNGRRVFFRSESDFLVVWEGAPGSSRAHLREGQTLKWQKYCINVPSCHFSSWPSDAIHVMVGPLFAGKTTTLLQRIHSETELGRSVSYSIEECGYQNIDITSLQVNACPRLNKELSIFVSREA
ncbi:hypothetical protein K2173_018029 [Erythroxylum novogranatense]|uniref:Thymidine kinase n=1 Tax=Erythroxylum novogranatense TaxID=1862640 RepID=A0AAV8TXW8_9ROSI|nr:hypothetical protein K2173_018029 [Erythroxylum novogranatense]